MLAATVETATRADRFVQTLFPGSSRQAIADSFAMGHVRVNGKRGKKGMRLSPGDRVEVCEPPIDARNSAPVAQPDLELVVLHEEASFLVLNKPAGQPTHPLRANERGTLANALVAAYPECQNAAKDAREGGVAHRLDRYTSGIVIAARTRSTWESLRAAFSSQSVDKEYLALVVGKMTRDSEIDAAIAQRGRKVLVDPTDTADGAQTAVTHITVEKSGPAHTLVRCQSSTGRMHQIRAHLAFAGTPIVGDTLYGALAGETPGFFLHAATIAFAHPDTQQPVEFEAPLPEAREAVLRRLL